jgi:hypothetical protein
MRPLPRLPCRRAHPPYEVRVMKARYPVVNEKE